MYVAQLIACLAIQNHYIVVISWEHLCLYVILILVFQAGGFFGFQGNSLVGWLNFILIDGFLGVMVVFIFVCGAEGFLLVKRVWYRLMGLEDS